MMPEYCIGSYQREQPIMIVGLSGVVYGLFGLLWMGRRWHTDMYAVCDQHMSQILLGWFFLCIVLTYANILPVANIAHGAGFGFGVLYGGALWSPRQRRRWLAAAVVITMLVLVTLVACPGHAGFEHVRRAGRLWWRL
jgi:membrane associated rhomboid family serine protease